jgi:NAD(P)H-dependent FMN reductase
MPSYFTAAEYNRGPTSVLNNALDCACTEWNNKPVAFVGYGAVGGARAIEQLRLNAIELQMAPIRTAVHILPLADLALIKEGKTLAEFDHLQETAKSMLDQLAWWTDALTTPRHKTLQSAACGQSEARLAPAGEATLLVVHPGRAGRAPICVLHPLR